MKDPDLETIAREYRAGVSASILALRYDLSPSKVYRMLEKLGVGRRNPGMPPGTRRPDRSKLSEKQVAWLLKQDLANTPHVEIARCVGVSPERVRQICAAANHPPRKPRCTKMSESRAAITARRQQRVDRVRLLSEAWKAGASMLEMAKLAELKTVTRRHGAALIVRLRGSHPEAFPYRRQGRACRHARCTEP